MLPRSKRFGLISVSGELKHCRNVRAGVANPGPLRGSSFIITDEPPGADPHAEWCGDWELDTPGYPIRHHQRAGGLRSELPSLSKGPAKMAEATVVHL
jgi:hypothetical protein